MPKTKILPWSTWDATLEHMGEWLLVGAIASIGLPAIPGIICLLAILLFFSLRQTSEPDTEIKNLVELRDKKKAKSLSKEEEIALSKYEAGLFIYPPKRNLKCYWVGVIFWLCSLIYLIGWTGCHCKNWFP